MPITLQAIRDVLAWALVFNFGLLLIWGLLFLFARDWMYKVHSSRFTLTEERFDTIHYSGMAAYKIGICLFNLAPYLALRIVA